MTTLTPSQAVRDLVSKMDEKFTRWDIYRTCLGAWKLKAEQATQTCEIESDDFVAAMEEALTWRALPLVPRPPSMLYRELFALKKNGSKWRVTYGGSDCCIQVDTKKEAEAFIDRQVAMSKSECDGWEINYGWSRDKVEGVDFRWAR